MSRKDFRTTQDRYFVAADAARYRWMTEDPGFAPVEDALLAPWLDALPFPCLEVGCGEGSNLGRLARRGHPVGLDLYPGRTRLAARAGPGGAAARGRCVPGSVPGRRLRRRLRARPPASHRDTARRAAEAV